MNALGMCYIKEKRIDINVRTIALPPAAVREIILHINPDTTLVDRIFKKLILFTARAVYVWLIINELLSVQSLMFHIHNV